MKWNDIEQKLGIDLQPFIESLEKLEAMISRWNAKHNLISAQDLPHIRVRHVLDSLMPLTWLDARTAKTWVDFGCGTGFPLLPLAIALPECQFVGIEPRAKRVLFIRQMARELGLKNVQMFEGHAEDFHGQFKADWVSARAVGSLDEDWSRAQGLMSEQGVFCTFKTSPEILNGADDVRCEHLPYQTVGYSKDYFLVRISHS